MAHRLNPAPKYRRRRAVALVILGIVVMLALFAYWSATASFGATPTPTGEELHQLGITPGQYTERMK